MGQWRDGMIREGTGGSRHGVKIGANRGSCRSGGGSRPHGGGGGRASCGQGLGREESGRIIGEQVRVVYFRGREEVGAWAMVLRQCGWGGVAGSRWHWRQVVGPGIDGFVVAEREGEVGKELEPFHGGNGRGCAGVVVGAGGAGDTAERGQAGGRAHRAGEG